MKVRFTLEALNHINAIHFYIEGRSPQAATHIVKRIYADCERLAEFPKIGHVGMVSSTYEGQWADSPTSSCTRWTRTVTKSSYSEYSTGRKIGDRSIDSVRLRRRAFVNGAVTRPPFGFNP
jgi:plasmid stabilization system protein ParE